MPSLSVLLGLQSVDSLNNDTRITNFSHVGDPVVALPLFSIGSDIRVNLPYLQNLLPDEHYRANYLISVSLINESELFDFWDKQLIYIGSNNGDSISATGASSYYLLGDAGNDTLRGGGSRDLIGGGTHNDIIVGNGEDDILYGHGGDDTITGGHGNDIIDGGEGGESQGDVAFYSGNYNEYWIVTSNGVTTITNTRGYDGIDTVKNVEYFQFGSGLLIAAANVDTPPPQSVSTPAVVVPVLEPVTNSSPPPPPPPSAPPTIYANAFSFSEGDSGFKNGTARVYLSKAATTDVTFTYNFAGKDSVGWAKFSQDYQITAGTAVIRAGATFVDIVLPVIGDTKIEGDESLWLLLGNAQGAGFAGGARILTVNGTIRDNDVATTPPPPPPLVVQPHGPIYLSLEADDASLVEGPDGTFTVFTFTAHRTGDLSVETKVRYEVSGFGATPASANDFQGNVYPTSNDVFSIGQTFDEFVVRVKGDFTTEANEAFQVRLIAESPGVRVTDATAAVTIQNDDGSTLPTPAGNVYVSIRPFDANKFEGTAATGKRHSFLRSGAKVI